MRLGEGFTVKAFFPPPTIKVIDLTDANGKLTNLEIEDVMYLRRFLGDGLSVDHITLEIHRGKERVNFLVELKNPLDKQSFISKRNSIIIVHKTNDPDLRRAVDRDHLLDRFFNIQITTRLLPPGVHDDPSQMIGLKVVDIKKPAADTK